MQKMPRKKSYKKTKLEEMEFSLKLGAEYRELGPFILGFVASTSISVINKVDTYAFQYEKGY